MNRLISTAVLITGTALLIPIFGIIILTTWISSIPSRVGGALSGNEISRRLLSLIIDFELMREFRNDIFITILPHISIEENLDRWWILHEMRETIDKTERSIQAGEYFIAVTFSCATLFINSPVFGIPLSGILTILILLFSGLVIVRVVSIDILMFDPELHSEEPTDELALRMAFNKGPLSEGASIGLLAISMMIGLSGGLGYQSGLELLERYSEKSHPDDGERWVIKQDQ